MTAMARDNTSPFPTPAQVLESWFSEFLTWEAFQRSTDAEMTQSVLEHLTRSGYSVVPPFEPDNHHNAALCPYCTPR